jgi:hypothetical protein
MVCCASLKAHDAFAKPVFCLCVLWGTPEVTLVMQLVLLLVVHLLLVVWLCCLLVPQHLQLAYSG